MPTPTLLDRRLVVVTGKGGVGKSTVSAALAVLAAREGKRVLVCEVNARERIAPLLGAPPAGPQIREARPGLFTLNVTPPEAMREYGIMVLKFRTIYDAVFENRLVQNFIEATPGLSDMVSIGKVYSLTEAYDLVIVDAPATGHGLALLEIPAIVSRASACVTMVPVT